MTASCVGRRPRGCHGSLLRRPGRITGLLLCALATLLTTSACSPSPEMVSESAQSAGGTEAPGPFFEQADGAAVGSPNGWPHPLYLPEADRSLLPTLHVAVGGSPWEWTPAAVTWTRPDGSVCEWRCRITNTTLSVGPEVAVDFALTGSPESPQAVTIALYRTGPGQPPAELGDPIESWSADGAATGAGSGFQWTSPASIAAGADPAASPDSDLLLCVTLMWDDTRVLEYRSFVQAGVLADGALDAARALFRALWAGDEQAVADLLYRPAQFKAGPDTASSLTSAAFGGGLAARWEFLTWQPGFARIELCSEPSYEVRPSGYVSRTSQVTVRVEFDVVASPIGATGQLSQVTRYHFTELHHCFHTGDGWRLDYFVRRGAPYREAEGAQLGYQPTFFRDQAGNLCFGPLAGSRLVEVVANPVDGRLALVAPGVGEYELWLLDLAKESAVRLVAIPTTPHPEAPLNDTRLGQNVYLLGWLPGSEAVGLEIEGLQPVGPFAGQQGLWFSRVDVRDPSLDSIAFLPAAGRFEPCLVAPDLSAAYECIVGRLLRVDLRSGSVTTLAEDVVEHDVLSCWPASGIRKRPFDISPNHVGLRYDQRLLDLATGRWATIAHSPGEGIYAEMSGWTPDDVLMVSDALRDELIVVPEGDISVYTVVGSLAVTLYGRDGEPIGTVRPPGDAGQRIGQRHTVWSADGRALVFTVGPVVDLTHEAREIYLWDRYTDSYLRLADVTDPISQLSWVSPDVVRVWYQPSVPAAGCAWMDFHLGLDQGYRLLEAPRFEAEGYVLQQWSQPAVLRHRTTGELVSVALDGSLVPFDPPPRRHPVAQLAGLTVLIDTSPQYGGVGTVFLVFDPEPSDE